MAKFFMAFLMITSFSFGTETKFISDKGFQNVWLWQLSNTTVTQEKGISLAPKSEKLYSNKQLLWTGKLIDNQFYIGTAETGTLIKVDSNFNEEVLFTASNQAFISAIVKDQNGLLIAASPESQLYHLDTNNQLITNTSLSNTYIWDIVANPQGGFDILTGLRAEVYTYSNYTLSSPITIETEEHLLEGMYVDNTLWVLGEKGLYKKQNDKFIAVASLQGAASGFIYTNNSFYVLQTITIEANPANNQAEQIISKLTRVSADTGSTEELYSLNGSYFTSIHMANNQIFIGADQYGLYIVYDLVTKKNYYANLGTGKILEIFDKGQNIIMLTSDSSALWQLQTGISSEGSFISEVYDAKNTATWGEFSAQLSAPSNTSVQFFVQSGVTPNPYYWGDWVEIKNNQKLPISASRYMRYKAVLKSGNQNAPYISSIKFPYTQINVAPVINNTTVEQQENTIMFSWNTSDPNGDTLEYEVWLAEDGLPSIKLTEQAIRETNFSFPLKRYPSGAKKITLIASDRPSNSDKTKLTTEFTSIPQMFDGDNPVISDIKVTKNQNNATLTFSATDQNSAIKQASYIINGKQRVFLTPFDGIFDNKTENFSFEIPNTTATFIQINVIDTANNTNTKGTTILPVVNQ